MIFMKTVDILKEQLDCKTDKDLGALFFRGDKAVSVWRKKGLPKAILTRAEEIIDERAKVFDGDLKYASDRPFQVVQEIGPEKKRASSPLAAAILALVEAMTPDQQAAELKRLTDQFTSSQTTEKS